jgi:DeoR/GlpR family transcriptional regulator of sugar metabolism
MLALERHRRLIDLLLKDGSVRTADAAKALGVTEETMRRDFEKLEAEGALLRSHGGAVRMEPMRRDVPSQERMNENASEKARIAAAALKRIEAGQTIFFDASTTVQQLARMLSGLPLTVLTDALHTALILAEKPEVRVILLGGELLPRSLSCAGWHAIRALDCHRIDAAFFSCRGFDAERGLSEASEEQAQLKQRVIRISEKNHLLADASKAGLQSSFFYADVSDLGVWITDRKPDSPMARAFASRRVPIEIAS